MGLLSNRVAREELQAGDHIYSWRAYYSYAHHGIYVGHGKVIHFTRGVDLELGTGTALDKFIGSLAPHNSSSVCIECGHHEHNKKGVKISCLDCFLSKMPLYRFEYGVHTATFLAKARGGTCTLAISDPPEEVVHRAVFLLENGFGGYHIFRNNCEDFALYCKTGLLVMDENGPGRSGQAVSMLFGVPVAAVLMSPVGLAISTGVYCLSRYAIDLGIRQDVVKVSVEDLAVNMGWSESESAGGSRSMIKDGGSGS